MTLPLLLQRALAALVMNACAMGAALAATATAPPPPPPPVGWLPPPQVVCAQDRETFCREVTPGYGRVETCLAAHLGELRPECRIYLENKRAARQAAGKEFDPEPAAE